MVSELLKLKKESLFLPGFDVDETKDMLDFVCTD